MQAKPMQYEHVKHTTRPCNATSETTYKHANMIQCKHATNAMQHVKHAKCIKMGLYRNEKALAYPKTVAKGTKMMVPTCKTSMQINGPKTKA